MKYITALVLGVLVGAIIFVAGLTYNPFSTDRGVSTLSVTDQDVIALSFSRVSTENIIYTNNGESLQQSAIARALRIWKAPLRSTTPPHPAKVLQLWEAPIRSTEALVTVMRDARNQAAGIGIKISSDSEQSRLLQGEVIVDSVWYILLPEHGTFFIEQTENYWPFVSEVALPAWRSSGNSWRGSWLGNLTSGPGALGTSAVSGAAGRVDGFEMNGDESLTVRAFSADSGLVAGAEGRLIIELPVSSETDQLDESDQPELDQP